LTQGNLGSDNFARAELIELSSNVIRNQITSRRNMKFRISLTLLALATLNFAPRLHGQSSQGASQEQLHERSSFHLVEATISDIEQAYRSHLLTPEQLVKMYQDRITAYDGLATTPHLSSYMHLNDHAIDAANQLDNHDDNARRDLPLFGVPMVLKDNINTLDMPTTAGSVALGLSMPPQDATVAAKLRKAGAIILGKGSLTEFANFLTNGMPAGFSSQLRFQQTGAGGDLATDGYGFNPYDPRPDPRAGVHDGRPALSPGGSSSGPGIAVSANLAAVGIGTETSGSILSPGFQNMLVGIKPTIGLVSRTGIVPITEDQDTAGPLARTVTDAAKVLGVIAGYDPQDPATAACLTPGNCLSDYTGFLNKDALRGARIAVPYYSYWTTGSGRETMSVERANVMENAVAVLRSLGAIVTDCNQFYAAEYGANGYQNGPTNGQQPQDFFNCPGEIPDQAALNAFGGCGSLPPQPANCSTVLLYGFKHDLNKYLLATYGSAGATSDSGTPVTSLADVIAYNNANAAVALKYGQILAIAAQALDTSPLSADTARYHSDRAEDLRLAKTMGLDVMYQHFDATLFPANNGANIAARAGYPSITIPGGFYVNPPAPISTLLSPPTPFPAGFDAQPAPYGVTFSGPAFSEGRLIGFTYAFEQATHHRQAPASAPALASDLVERDQDKN
jgi:amidase